ncbi:MAG: methyltransferase domain-containing protein [Patescibacteria group bacterium]
MGYFLFLKNSLRNFNQIGAFVPSSQFLARTMLEGVQIPRAQCVVEFGGGTGAITAPILKLLPSTATLIVFELNKELALHLRDTIRDHRVRVVCDHAERIGYYLKKYGYKKADYIISSLPLAHYGQRALTHVLSEIVTHLHPHGVYVQYQYSLRSFWQVKKVFGNVALKFELYNFPPAFVYVCQQQRKK